MLWTVLRITPGSAPPTVVEINIEINSATNLREYITDNYIHDDVDGTWYSAVCLNANGSVFSWEVASTKHLR